MDHERMDKQPSVSDSIAIKQEQVSRENTPFHHTSSVPPQSRHNTPAVLPSITPVVDTDNPPCSQESSNTVSTAPIPNTPLKPKVEEDPVATTPLIQDSPSNNPASSRRKKRKSRRGKATAVDTISPSNQMEPPPPPMNLTHANKHWFDVFHAKQSGQSISTIATEHNNTIIPAPTTIQIEQQFNYLKEIIERSISWVMLPLRWTAHWTALYLLPFAIALGILALITYLIFPRYIFSAIPSILTTTTSIVVFPAKIFVTKTPEIWCSYVGIGCHRNNSEGEEVVRNATFATDLEVRNAFTVIHNLNYLNNSSNRLVLDSVLIPR
jgi:hypothetical protein